ncbi:MAG: ABC transporter ATP-binding protein, partial [Thalassobaculaceae bacterium]
MSLNAEGLTFSYAKRPILTNVTLTSLAPGKLTVLIGPNASGKSTLFRVIAGLLRPATGTVSLNNVDLSGLSTKVRLQRVCFMPQFFTTSAVLKVFDVVMMAHKNLSGWRVTSQDTHAVGQILHESQIGHLAEAYIGELSGGQAQMVSVAQALI